MATVTPQMIKELRDRTQAGMSDCKGALTEAEGDMEKAVEIILKKGQAKSAKRAGAVATEGEVRASVSPDKRAATVVEVNSQTDFVARNDQFQKFVGDVLALAEKTAQGADLGAAPLDGKTVADAASDLTAKIGEKIAVRRWARVEVAAGKLGLAHSYTHLGGKIGVVLALETDSAATAAHAATAELADTIAMQIAAMNPGVLERGEVDAAEVAKQREIFEAQLAEDPKPKPKEAWPKIIEGKVNKWFSEVALLEQESVQTPGQTIDKLRQAAEKTAGGTITVKAFVRFERGEGLSKKQDDFAAEVAKMAGA
jgi:elongation factor Ts